MTTRTKSKPEKKKKEKEGNNGTKQVQRGAHTEQCPKVTLTLSRPQPRGGPSGMCNYCAATATPKAVSGADDEAVVLPAVCKVNTEDDAGVAAFSRSPGAGSVL
eukprot:m.23156 g.23156  ORF g.23156 m.23156 type:complete len:104 (-) comp7081_c0_seq1:2148-2459(-)